MARRRLPVVALVLLGVLLGGAPAARAATDLDVHVTVGRPGDRFVLKGPVDLRPGQTADRIVVVDGRVTVPRGATVTGDLVTVDGPALIAGTVRGRVVTLGAAAELAPTAVVGDGVRYGTHAPRVAPGAQVTGGVRRVDVRARDIAPFVPVIGWWIAVGLSSLALGLLALWLAPRAADATFELMRDGGWGPALGVGFVLVIGLPALALLALVTLVGVPFAIGLLLALLPLAALGYVTCAWVLGRALVGPPGRRALAFFAGWAILRVVALIPVLGALVFAVAAMFGLGALAWALWRARRPSGPGRGPESPLAPAI